MLHKNQGHHALQRKQCEITNKPKRINIQERNAGILPKFFLRFEFVNWNTDKIRRNIF